MTQSLAQFALALPGGFLDSSQLAALVALDRLCPVNVRCDGGRFTCPARDCAHFIALIERGEREHVLSISITKATLAEAHGYRALSVLVPDAKMFSEPAEAAPVRCGIRGNYPVRL